MGVSGTLAGNGNSIVGSSDITCGTLHVVGSIDVKLGGWVEWKVASIETDLFQGGTFSSGEVTLITIGN